MPKAGYKNKYIGTAVKRDSQPKRRTGLAGHADVQSGAREEMCYLVPLVSRAVYRYGVLCAVLVRVLNEVVSLLMD